MQSRNLNAVGRRMCWRNEAERLKKNLSHNKLKWKTIKDDRKDDCFLTALNDNGTLITSQAKIAETLATNFQEKVSKVRENFKEDENEAIKILEKLCVKRDNEFEFKKVSRERMYDIITESAASKTTSDDAISMDLIKQIPALMSEVMEAIFNKMIDQNKFPQCLKVARVLPLRKQGKCKLDKNLYRPISILNPIEKILEHEMKKQLTDYFEGKNIIPDSHHGGRTGHSTLTAKAVIDKNAADKVEDHEETVLLTMDLSQAYDLVDHKIMIKKLKFHGVGENSCRLVQSFLADRGYYVEVQGAKSKMMKLMGVSVVQGSKNGGFLYTVYNIEIIHLPKVMKDAVLYEEITGEEAIECEETEHDVNQYVEDRTNTIGAPSLKVMKDYIEKYMVLLEHFYTKNRLKINSEKTKFLLMNNRKKTNKLEIKLKSGEVLKNDLAIRILGWWMTPNF